MSRIWVVEHNIDGKWYVTTQHSLRDDAEKHMEYLNGKWGMPRRVVAYERVEPKPRCVPKRRGK